MPIASPRYALTSPMVSGAPNDPGVYALWEDDELIYYGHARGESATIQSCLQQHMRRENGCTAQATHYGWEISANPPQREQQCVADGRYFLLRKPLQNDAAQFRLYCGLEQFE